MNKQQEYFCISKLHRDNLKDIGFDTTNIDDDTMQILANKLESDYTEQLFWGSLEIIADILEIPRKKK